MTRQSVSEHLADNAFQLEQRRSHNDQLDQPRIIDHNGAVTNKRAASAAQALRDLGYEVTLRKGLRRTTIEASKAERLDGGEPDRFVTEVATVFEEHDGAYDGWGGMVVGPRES